MELYFTVHVVVSSNIQVRRPRFSFKVLVPFLFVVL